MNLFKFQNEAIKNFIQSINTPDNVISRGLQILGSDISELKSGYELKKMESTILDSLEMLTFANKVIWCMDYRGDFTGFAVEDSVLANCKISIRSDRSTKIPKYCIELEKCMYRNLGKERRKKVEASYSFSCKPSRIRQLFEAIRLKVVQNHN